MSSLLNANTGEVCVADTKQLDFETASSHVLQIQAADRSVTNTAELTINVDNFNEFKPDIRDATANQIAEDSAAGTVVFDINDASSNTDVDADQQALSYEIIGGNVMAYSPSTRQRVKSELPITNHSTLKPMVDRSTN